MFLTIWPPGKGPTTAQTPPSGVTSTAPQQSEASRAPLTALEVGDCLDPGLTSMTRCDVEHGYEVFALDDCDDSALLTYLGGNPTVDIVRATPRRVDVSGSAACVVSPPAGAPDDLPAAGVLQGPDDDAWRSCIDDRTGQQDVSCAAPHTGEWVSTEPPTDDAVDCEELATRYLDAPPTRFTGRLQVGSSRGPAGPRCFVTVLGGDLLTGSLRDIGVSSLPTD
ncbi:hypothetical protein [Geodermatophilus siccatus]|uniref:hypothetical protein n=1 Tax=Geodermatophilus siccatus TaxID=1137991 RepID=UPI001113AE2C|nr:hypothetical protein [Geodermatophilus siccatus]